MGSACPQRWQLRSPGGLATPQAGLAHRFGGPSGSAGPVSACSMKPQSMQATAPSLSLEPHAGQLAGVWIVLAPAPLLVSTDGELGDPAGRGGAAGAPPAGTWKGCLHDGHCTRLPAALSGNCIAL